MAALLVVLGVSLLLSVPGLRPVLREVRGINPLWIVAAIALELASDISFVVLFRAFFDNLPGRDARPLAWVNMASGALLPGGGAGGLAIGGWLIHLTGVPTQYIVRRSGGLFFLTTAVNAASIVAAGVLLSTGVSHPSQFSLAELPALAVIGVTTGVIFAAHVVDRRPNAVRWVRALAGGVRDAEGTTFHSPSWRLVGAIGYLGCDMAVLGIALAAVGHPMSIRRSSLPTTSAISPALFPFPVVSACSTPAWPVRSSCTALRLVTSSRACSSITRSHCGSLASAACSPTCGFAHV